MSKLITATTAIFITALFAGIAAAETESRDDFAFQHPLRTEIAYRIERVKWAVEKRIEAGDFTTKQAAAIRAQADRIRGEADYFASQHGGRLSDLEVRRLNWEINQLAARIGA